MIEATATDSAVVAKAINVELAETKNREIYRKTRLPSNFINLGANKKKMRLPLAPKNIRRLTVFGWKKSPKYDEWIYKITP